MYHLMRADSRKKVTHPSVLGYRVILLQHIRDLMWFLFYALQ